ncbi:MAG TPA: hypothetical protein VIA07_08530 [Desulfuromonadales bacterium]
MGNCCSSQRNPLFTLAIAFGLGCRAVAREYLEKKLREPPTEDDIQLL